ncbi:MAG: sugar transporter [Muribaculum sp.]|nr:sugar transporter [Muribaculum sp.]
MSQESRVKKTLLNARVNLMFYSLTLLLSFFSRKVFLDCLGANFVGLTGTLQNLLGFLNLAELGISSAIGYLLYKPLLHGDKIKINEIISVMGYLYRKIGIVILVAGLILSAFLPVIFPDSNTGFDLLLIYAAYYAFLISSIIGYFINYRQNLLGADQRNYVITAYFQSTAIIKTIAQITVAYYTNSYYLWIIIELSFNIIYSFILNWKIDQTYPWLKSEIRLGKMLFKKYPEVTTYTKQLFVHQINNFTQYQTTPILTYAFVSLRVVALYGNYTIIVDKFIMLMNTVLGSTAASIGNLIAEGNHTKNESIFWELTAFRFWCGATITFILYFSLEYFISLWVGTEYLLPQIILILLLSRIFIQISEGAINQFLYGYGLFRDVWASVLQSVIFLMGAIIGGHYWGLKGILTASIISIFLINGIWKPYFLYKEGFKLSTFIYWKKWMLNMIIVIISWILIGILCVYIRNHINTNDWLNYCVYISVISIAYVTLSVLLFYSLNHCYRSTVNRFFIPILKKFK